MPFRRLLVICLTLAACSQGARAYGDRQPFCSEAEAALRGGARGEEYVTALRSLHSCPLRGPELLIEQWATPRADESSLDFLVSISGAIPDRRLFEALRSIARDTASSRPRRLRAMAAFTGQSHHCISASYRANAQGGLNVLVTQLDHGSPQRVAQPIPGDPREQVLATLDSLSTDADPEVARNARGAARALRMIANPQCASTFTKQERPT